MADSDPFSGILLCPPLADTDNISFADALSLVLSDYNNIHQPTLRALANFIATKISSLTNTQIARLSDDKIARLIDAELSRLSDDEIKLLIDSQISTFFDSIGNAISSFFASVVASMIDEITPSFIKQNPDTAFKIFQVFLFIGSGIIGILIGNKIDKWIHQRFISSITQESLSRMPPARHVVSVPAQVSNDTGVESPMPISVKLGAVKNIFRRIVTAAEHLHLSTIKTEAEKIRKQYPRLTDPTLMFSVGLGVVVTVKMAAAWKNASG